MVKIKMKLSLIFTLCFLAVVVFGNDSNDSNPTENPSPNPSPVEYLEGLAKYFKALENRNQELEKSQEDLKDLKTTYEKSQLELKEEVKSLKEEVEKLKQGISQDRGVWLLTPPLRGPPAKKGGNGSQGLTGPQGARGEKGETGPPGPSGPKGETGNQGPTGAKGDRGENCEKGDKGDGGQDGTRGEKGEKGPVGPKGDQGVSALQSITSCSDTMENLPSARSKKQSVDIHGNPYKVEVLCDFVTDGGGWTIIQKRSSGPKEDFNRNWNEYEKGFGSLDGNFWIGLENIRALTKNGDQELRIELEDFEGEKRYAKYSSFSVSDASDFYRLTIDGFSGNAGDANSMISSSGPSYVHHGKQFSTKDKNPDSLGCVNSYGGGWWFHGACMRAHLNGFYREKGETIPYYQGILWASWKGLSYSLAKTEMKIRKRK